MNLHTEKLEGLLQAQAMDLAERHLENGRRASEQILREVQERLRQLEAGEELRFQIEAEHLCRQIMQTAKLRMDAEIDRLRWALTQGVLAEVRTRLQNIMHEPERYRAALGRYLAEAAHAIPEGDLVSELNARDVEWMRSHWDALVEQAAPGRRIQLSVLAGHSDGGMRVSRQDGSRRIDNTFEGRLARMENELLRVIMDRLFPSNQENKTAT